MGRVDYIESPSGVPTDPAIIDYNYPNYFTTVITDPDNKQKTEKRDHLGRIIEVIEHANTGNQSTFYWYNAAGDMLELENALGYSTLITYDARGLKLTMDDPDMGYWTYTYDENGNLSTQTDAKGDIITFGYELLNRISSKTYTILNPQTGTTPNVTYTYDNAINGIGQLYSVTNSNVTTTFNEYDEMGRVLSVTKTITGDQPRTTETEYDLSGKVINITHPDGFEVRNTYYPGTNLLDSVKGTFDDVNIKEYAKCTEYEPTGKIGRITHTYNDTETVYTYNPHTTRLENLLTSGPSPINYVIQNRLYTYSKAGDLLTITDSSGSTPVTYTYQYDNLHRLLSEDVAGALSPPTTAEALIFTYNALTI
jgi:YD repeat-containing protein